jgi:hypothetical protein
MATMMIIINIMASIAINGSSLFSGDRMMVDV